jgi:hypothetical protein
VIAIRGYNKYDTMSFCGCARDGTTRTDAFIIGMSMKTNKS